MRRIIVLCAVVLSSALVLGCESKPADNAGKAGAADAAGAKAGGEGGEAAAEPRITEAEKTKMTQEFEAEAKKTITPDNAASVAAELEKELEKELGELK